MIKRPLALFLVLLLAGCAGGPIFWTRPGAGVADFQRDHDVCFKAATIGYGIGSEKAYKACMTMKNWGRTHTASGLPDASHFRGPEGDDEFARSLSQEEATKQLLRDEKFKRSYRETGDGALCARPAGLRPPGLVCR